MAPGELRPLAGIRPRGSPWLPFLALALVAFSLWQLGAADLTFIRDDWIVLASRSLTIESLLVPYNEHLSAIPIALLVVLRDAIGLGWHAAYLVPLLAAHLAASAGLFAIALRRTRPATALVLATLALFMGTGFADLLWVFQVGAVISVATGVWALDALDRQAPRSVLAALLIGLGLASSSFAMPFAAAALMLAILRRQRRALVGLALVGVVYAAWYLAYHSTAPGLCGPTAALDLARLAIPYAFATLVYAVGAPLGLGLSAQALVPLAAVLALLWVLGLAFAWRQGRRVHLAVAAAVGILVMGVLVAYSRSCLGPQATGASRYVYATGMLALVGFAGTRLGGPPERLVDRPPRPVLAAALGVVLVLQLLALSDGHAYLRASSDAVRAGVAVVLGDPAGRCHTAPAVVDDMTADIDMLPPPALLRVLVPSASLIAVPSWHPNAALDPATVAQVRHIMCDLPPAGG